MTDRAKGISCIIASAFGFALMAFFVRLCDDCGPSLSCFQKGFFRNAVAFVLALIVFLRYVGKKNAIQCSRQAYPALFARCLFGTVGIFANFYAISHIHVGEAMALNKTAPFFTVLGSWLLLGEKASRKQFVCLVFAFVGAMLVVKPGLRTDNLGAALWGLSSGLGAGLAYTAVHVLGCLKVTSTLIVLVFSAFSCLASVPFMILDFQPMTIQQCVILLGAGTGAALGQFGITLAYRFAQPRAIAAYDYVGVVFSALFGLVFFNQVPDLVSVVGFVVILLCVLRLRK